MYDLSRLLKRQLVSIILLLTARVTILTRLRSVEIHRDNLILASNSFDLLVSVRMVRKLKFHEQKLLKKVDFVSWESDKKHHERDILKKFHIKKREHYSMYMKLAAKTHELAKKIKELKDNDPFRTEKAQQLLGRLYEMGVIQTADTLERCEKVSASAFCRRRLAVVMCKLQMAQRPEEASDRIEQGHVRVGVELVTDPAYLVSRAAEDNITWAKHSKIRKHIAEYNNQRDDFEDA
uniref:S4 RNA-binding domain-containing protein n=1 Tax=Steinernema glaseri TaxID=37863 RepID=A0A1I7ZR58_9BILA